MRSLLLISVAVSGSTIPSTTATALPLSSQICTEVEGAMIGKLPLSLDLDGEPIAFAEWTMQDERSPHFVGFAASVPGNVVYTVKAGDEFRGASPRWLNPFGVSGPKVRGIERITFCRLAAR